MPKIIKYTNTRGTFYRFRLYCGKDAFTGRSKYKTASGFKSYEAAQAALRRLEFEKSTGKLTRSNLTANILELTEIWLKVHRPTVREDTYYKQENKIYKHLLPMLGQYRADKLRLYDVQEAANKWAAVAPHEVGFLVNTLSRVLEYARKNGYTVNNPTKDVIKPRPPQKRNKQNFFTRDELRRFLNSVKEANKPHFIAFFNLLAFTGVRIGEALALEWADVDFKNKTISINKTVSGKTIAPPKTAAGNRTIIISDELVAILKEWKATQTRQFFAMGLAKKANKSLFTNETGSGRLSKTTVNTFLKAQLKKCHLHHVSCHGFRHTHATLLIEGGASIRAVADRLGHSNVDITLNTYTHATQQARKQTANIFSHVMNE